MTKINHETIQESLVAMETLANKLCEEMSWLIEQGEIMGGWNNLASRFDNKSKTISRLEMHKTKMSMALEMSLECFEMNGFGKGYVMDVIRDTLREVARGEE